MASLVDQVQLNKCISKEKAKFPKCREFKIYNYWMYHYKLDYDYNYYIYEIAPLEELIRLYIHEKNNQLTEEERKMFHQYRDFNLEDLLCNDNESKYSINNRNGGVITIGEMQMYASTLKKKQHSEEIRSHIHQLHPEINCETLNIPGIVRLSNCIIIQINLGELILWCPDTLTDFQSQQLDDLEQFVFTLNQKLITQNQLPVDILGVVIQPADDLEDFDSMTNFNSFKEMKTIYKKRSV